MPTKTAIAQTYREQLLAAYPWAQDEAKLNKFMEGVWKTLDGGNVIDRTGHSWLRALELNGLYSKKQQTLKAIHALPRE